MVIKNLMTGSSIPSDVKIHARQFIFSLEDGVVLKNLSISRGDKNFVIPRFAIKKNNGFISIKIKGVLLDLNLLKSLIAIPIGSSASNGVSLKVRLDDIDFLSQGKTINIDHGSISSGKNGVHWDLRFTYQGLNLNARGYASLERELCFFNFTSEFMKTVLVGEYDLKRKILRGGVFFRGDFYRLGAKALSEHGVLSLIDVSLGPLSIPGPIELNLNKGLSFNWAIQGGSLDASGFLDFKSEEDRLRFYVKVLKAQFGEYELITNSYIDYLIDENSLVFDSVGTVLNKMPFSEISFKAALTDRGVVLERFGYEGGISLSGYCDYNLNHSIQGEFNDFNLHEMMTVVMPLYARYLSVPKINGEFNYFFYDDTRFTDVALELGEGRIIDVVFESGRVHLMGNSNILEFVNSELVIDGMRLAFEGNVDIAEFPTTAMWEDVFLVPISTSYPFGDISFEDRFGDRKMSLGAKLKENVRLDYNVEFSADENYNKNEVSLEIIGIPNLKLRLKDNEEIMGVEKNIKF
ncbi:MAG: hypothetical protein P9X27_03750 [Candidatus Kaelpia aquatica]|nr:hypothetical protein [Candidatus Kaelpia aquatica]